MRILLDENLDWLKLSGHGLKIVVLRARSNRLAGTIPLTPKILQILPYIENGTLTLIE
jgi:hypothetical protein